MHNVSIGRVRYLLTTLLLLSLLSAPMAGNAAAQNRAAVRPVAVSNPATQAADAAIAWLRTEQQADGSFVPGDGSAIGATVDLILASAALGEQAFAWSKSASQPTAQDYLASQAAAYVQGTNAGNAGKLLAAVGAGNRDPHAFAGLDLVSITLGYHQGSGLFSSDPAQQAWALLGLLAAQEPLPSGSLETLAALQQSNGSWAGSTDTTALALQALAAGGYADNGSTVLIDALAYLKAKQVGSGGFMAFDGSESNAQSTALAIQALIAMGVNPLSADWMAGSVSALDDLLALQTPSGAFVPHAGAGGSLTATIAALPALVGRPLPIVGARVAIGAALDYLRSLQLANGALQGNLSWDTEGLLALASAGELPRLWRQSGGQSLLDYLTDAQAQTVDSGQVGRLIAALAMAEENPYLLGNVNLVDRLWQYYDPATGTFDKHGEVYNQMLALWGLLAIGQEPPAAAIQWLWDQQGSDGGWEWGAGFGSDTNSTSLAVQTLVAAGADRSDPRLAQARQWLATQQFEDAGFSYDKSSPWTTGADANSTALVIQALLALDPQALTSWEWANQLTATDAITLTVNRPIDCLIGFQLPSGALEWQPGWGENYVATVEAIPALAARPFPWTHSRLPAAHSALAWLKAQQQSNGSFGTADPVGATIEALFAGVALGEDVGAWSVDDASATAPEYLAARTPDLLADPAALGRLLTAVIADDAPARTLAGVDLVAALEALNDGAGQYGSTPHSQSWALIGLAAARRPIDSSAIAALIAMQRADGSWSANGSSGDTATTALALQALAAAGVSEDAPEVAIALAWLGARQTSDAGFAAAAASTATDVRATSATIQALLALGDDPRAQDWLVSGRSALDALAQRQLGSGAWEAKPGAGGDVATTGQAAMALLLEVNPLCSGQLLVMLPLVGGR